MKIYRVFHQIPNPTDDDRGYVVAVFELVQKNNQLRWKYIYDTEISCKDIEYAKQHAKCLNIPFAGQVIGEYSQIEFKEHHI